ncbi:MULTISPECIES: WD40 repeat domain-containing protein [unclassified Campylobacter]|uniref:WD40 repeat domain-containing protein n=1 Tax=unclassified Campylobacter TaxID=2593542 RepID=UPI003D33CD41
MRKILVLLAFFGICFSAEISQPTRVVSAFSNVISSNLIDEMLYLGTDIGEVEIYDIKNDKFLPKIILPKKKAYFADEPSSRVFSIDRLDDKLLVLAELSYDERRLFVYKFDGEKFTEINNFITPNKSAKKAFFTSKNEAIISDFGNEIYIVDLTSAQLKFKHKFSIALYVDFEISKNRDKIAIGAESGVIYEYDLKTRQVIKTHNFFKDNMYDIDYVDDALAVGSITRQVGVFDGSNLNYFNADFIVYALALSPDKSKIAFMNGEHSDIVVYDIKSKELLHTIKTGQEILSEIYLSNDGRIISIAYQKEVKFWSIK